MLSNADGSVESRCPRKLHFLKRIPNNSEWPSQSLSTSLILLV
jgi:hypothetical protein